MSEEEDFVVEVDLEDLLGYIKQTLEEKPTLEEK